MYRNRIFLALSCGFALSAAIPAAQAQTTTTTLQLQYNNGSSTCTFSTDQNGVHADPSTGNLIANGSFGSGCPSSPPPAPNFTTPLPTLAASTPQNSTITLNWAANADTCIYDGSGYPSGVTFTPAWPSSGQACNTTSTCAASHNVTGTASATGSYTFKLTCYYAANPSATVVSTATTSVGTAQACTGPTGLTRQTVANIYFGPTLQNNVDVTQFSNVWGAAFPGVNGKPAAIGISSGRFVALQFTAPTNIASGQGGALYNTQTYYTEPLSATISATCGDFGTSQISPYCTVSAVHAEQYIIPWVMGAGGTGQCPIQPGQTYYLNIVNAPLSNPSSTYCTSGLCYNNIVTNY